MRTTLLFVLLIAITSRLNAQNLNPYEQFGYKTKNQYVMTKKREGFFLLNKDTSGVTKNLLVDFKSKQFFVIDGYDNILQVFNVPAEALTRFISVDPLTKKYPELTPYQFAGNTPIQAIDLDGLEPFFIHGTTSDNSRWTLESQSTLLKLTNNKTSPQFFDWSNPHMVNLPIIDKGKAGINNDYDDRTAAGKRLAEFVKANRIEGEDITLIGHSHGGNVAIQAAKYIYEDLGVKVNIITIATPTYNDKFKNPLGSEDLSIYNRENPGNQSKYINDHIALWNPIDGVSGGLAGHDYYTNSNITRDIEVNVNRYYKNGQMGPIKFTTPEDKLKAHSFDVERPITIDKTAREYKTTTGQALKLKPVSNQ